MAIWNIEAFIEKNSIILKIQFRICKTIKRIAKCFGDQIFSKLYFEYSLPQFNCKINQLKLSLRFFN
jgi:hypothetical protein